MVKNRTGTGVFSQALLTTVNTTVYIWWVKFQRAFLEPPAFPQRLTRRRPPRRTATNETMGLFRAG